MEALLSTFFKFRPSIPVRVFGMWELLQRAGVDAGQLISLYFGVCVLYQAAHGIHNVWRPDLAPPAHACSTSTWVQYVQ
jgi:hypothetical protein